MRMFGCITTALTLGSNVASWTRKKFTRILKCRSSGYDCTLNHFFSRFAGNLYGTSHNAVRNVQKKGRICILDIEIQVSFLCNGQLHRFLFFYLEDSFSISSVEHYCTIVPLFFTEVILGDWTVSNLMKGDAKQGYIMLWNKTALI